MSEPAMTARKLSERTNEVGGDTFSASSSLLFARMSALPEYEARPGTHQIVEQVFSNGTFVASLRGSF